MSPKSLLERCLAALEAGGHTQSCAKRQKRPCNCDRKHLLADLATAIAEDYWAPTRVRLPDERKSITHKFEIAGYEGYVTVGMYDNGRPGEVFITMAKQGSTIRGFCDAIGLLISILLQHGVDVGVISSKLRGMNFEPAGYAVDGTQVSSILDYLSRWLSKTFPERLEPNDPPR